MKSLLKQMASALMLVIILFNSCKNPAEDVQIIVDSDIFKAPVLVKFVNAKAGGNVPKNFTVKIIGQNASLVRTTTGGTVFKSADGLLNLVLDRNANPTPQSPVRYTIIAEIPGYAPTFKDIELIDVAQPVVIAIPLTEYANPAESTGVGIANATIANGSATSELTFYTTTHAQMAEKSKVSVSVGTGFLDAAGQPLTGNQVETRIVHLAPKKSGTSNPSLPGGTIVQNVVNQNGEVISSGVYFNPITAVTINMQIGDKAVKRFTKPVAVDIELEDNTRNPTTGELLKENETVAVWSLDNGTGVWKADGAATIVKNTEGKWVARAQINHLSSFVIHTFDPLPIIPVSYVTGGISADIEILTTCISVLTIERPTADDEETFEIEGGEASVFVTLPKGAKSKSTIYLTGRSTSTTRNITVKGSERYAQLTLPSTSCRSRLNFSLQPNPNLINIAVNMMFKCTNKDLLTGINCYVLVKPIGADGKEGEGSVFQLKNGTASGAAVNGVTYKISTDIDGISYSSTFTAAKNNFALPNGSSLTGSANYNASTNTLSIAGTASKNCN